MDALTTDLDDFEYSETASSPGMIPIDLSSSTSIVSLSERLHFFFLFFCLDFWTKLLTHQKKRGGKKKKKKLKKTENRAHPDRFQSPSKTKQPAHQGSYFFIFLWRVFLVWDLIFDWFGVIQLTIYVFLFFFLCPFGDWYIFFSLVLFLLLLRMVVWDLTLCEILELISFHLWLSIFLATNLNSCICDLYGVSSFV